MTNEVKKNSVIAHTWQLADSWAEVIAVPEFHGHAEIILVEGLDAELGVGPGLPLRLQKMGFNVLFL